MQYSNVLRVHDRAACLGEWRGLKAGNRCVNKNAVQ